MAKNKNRRQSEQQRGQQQPTHERGAEQQAESGMQSDSPSPANLAEHSSKKKKFGHN